jgi:hypothetical protein
MNTPAIKTSLPVPRNSRLGHRFSSRGVDPDTVTTEFEVTKAVRTPKNRVALFLIHKSGHFWVEKGSVVRGNGISRPVEELEALYSTQVAPLLSSPDLLTERTRQLISEYRAELQAAA